MYNSVIEVTDRLAERYDGPISQREGPGGRTFSYIPWTETVRLLDNIFGQGGWSTSEPQVIFAAGVYTVSLTLKVLIPTADGEGFLKTVPGVGQAVARGDGDDNAAKSALSDAISRAAKLLGDAFGFFLYEKTAPTANGYAGAARESTPGQAKGPSDKQRQILLKNCGYTEATLAAAPFQQWKRDLDGYFEGIKAKQAVF